MRKKLLYLGCCIVGFFFIYSALIKSYSIYNVLETFRFLGIPEILLFPLSWSLILFELILGLLLTFGLWRKKILLTTQIVLVIFSGILIFLILAPNAPHCGCTGNFTIFKTAILDNILGLVRNIVFLSVLFFSYTKCDL